MFYVLIVLTTLTPQFIPFRDLDECLAAKEQRVNKGIDAHCVRWDEPASTVKDLKQ